MELLLSIFYLVYVAMSLTPLIIIFVLGKEFGTTTVYQFVIPNNILCVLCIIFVALILSYLYIYCVKKYKQNTQSEQMECGEIEIAEPKYIPIYITYFVIAVSINKLLIFCSVFILIYLLILKGKFSYFNPYLLFSYHFYRIFSFLDSAHRSRCQRLPGEGAGLHIKCTLAIAILSNRPGVIIYNFLDRGDKGHIPPRLV